MNLSFLLYLACPIGMGVMMWMMMRDNKGQPAQSGPATPPADLPALRQQLDSLEIQQQAIRAQMQRISDEDSPRQQADPAGRLVARRDESASKLAG